MRAQQGSLTGMLWLTAFSTFSFPLSNMRKLAVLVSLVDKYLVHDDLGSHLNLSTRGSLAKASWTYTMRSLIFFGHVWYWSDWMAWKKARLSVLQVGEFAGWHVKPMFHPPGFIPARHASILSPNLPGIGWAGAWRKPLTNVPYKLTFWCTQPRSDARHVREPDCFRCTCHSMRRGHHLSLGSISWIPQDIPIGIRENILDHMYWNPWKIQFKDRPVHRTSYSTWLRSELMRYTTSGLGE